jgi:eukaryotic-like serine/threonine-protein kinase
VHEASRYPKPFGKYLLIRQLAVGGMAEVYLARQSGPAGFEKECVIKRILPNLAVDQQFVHMFLDEARIAARLSHPNIVQIYEFGTVGDHDYFLAMEHVHGVDLQQMFDAETSRNGRIPLPIALRLISQVAEGLDHAHRATDGRGQKLGVVHRDVTPSNVIVSFDGVAKILDFGIAKASAKQGRTEVGVIKGKIPYMSPEQVQGEPLDGRSDLFSLGAVLYELTTGQKPFEGSNAAELSLKIAHDDPTPPEMLADGYPEGLSEIVRRALAKRKQGRFATGREMQEAIEEFLLGSRMRCTSHDVAAYLEDLLPGRREQLAEQVDIPVQVHDPTMPMNMKTGSGPTNKTNLGGADEGEHGPVMGGDLSSSQLGNYDDVRRNLGGSGKGVMFVMVLLVVGVAVGFWWLRGHMGGSEAAKPETSAAAKPGETKPADPGAATAAAAKPGETKPADPGAAATVAAKPGETKPGQPIVTPLGAETPGAKPGETKPAEAKSDAPGTKPGETKPAETKPVATKPGETKPAEAKSDAKSDAKTKAPAAKTHKTPATKHEDGPRTLPHLPTPPPADPE